MLYLSVQPAEPYFLWQLEIQLENFRQIGINADNIHVILGYNPEMDRPTIFDHLDRENLATFFYYPYDFSQKCYVSSIRPVLLEKHFKAVPDLYNQTIFYHDSDIVFRERIDEMRFKNDNIWYLSDTRSYLAADYLLKFGEQFFKDLCALVDISPKLVFNNISNTGGAQYILKNVDSSFWQDVFVDGEKIFSFIEQYNDTIRDTPKIQSWCADMWAILWNAWKRNIETRIDEELDFCWPREHISRWHSTKILHNSGICYQDRRDYFCKLLYKNNFPYYVDFSKINPKSCSSIFVSKIKQVQSAQNRIGLSELTIIFHEKELDQEYLSNYLRYIFKNFKVKIVLVKPTFSHRSYSDILDEFADLRVVESTIISQIIIQEVFTSFFLYLDTRILVTATGLLESYKYITHRPNDFVRPYDNVDDFEMVNREDFYHLLEIKTSKSTEQSIKNNFAAECYMMSKSRYVKSGGENLEWSYYLHNGFNLERESRIRFLGDEIHFVNAPSYMKKDLEKSSYHFNMGGAGVKERYYDRIKNGSKHVLLKELKILDYSNPAIANPVLYDQNEPFSIYIFNFTGASYSLDNIKDEFMDKSNFKLVFHPKLNSNRHTELWNTFISYIKKHNFRKQPFFIIADEGMSFSQNYQETQFLHIINQMLSFNLDYVSTGTSGGFKKVRRLSEHLIWVDKCLSIQMVVLSEDFCNKILNHKFVEGKAIDLQLSELTRLKCVAIPFFSTSSKKSRCTDGNQFKYYPNERDMDFINAENYISYEVNNP